MGDLGGCILQGFGPIKAQLSEAWKKAFFFWTFPVYLKWMFYELQFDLSNSSFNPALTDPFGAFKLIHKPFSELIDGIIWSSSGDVSWYAPCKYLCWLEVVLVGKQILFTILDSMGASLFQCSAAVLLDCLKITMKWYGHFCSNL